MSGILVFQSGFGISDGAVSAMYGVAISVDRSLRIYDITHDIPQFNIWEASYRLLQTFSYWPSNTVFVSVVDPGVGSERRSIVVKLITNQYIITPDNGTLTHIKNNNKIIEARIIDESIHRLPHSGASHTFHGRDIYAFTAAKLAANIITFEEIGPMVDIKSIVLLPIDDAHIKDKIIYGTIEISDVRFGNLWTNISRTLFEDLGIQYGDKTEVTIESDHRKVYKNIMTYGRSFADLQVGEPLIYINSLDTIGVAINQGSFAKAYNIESGPSWRITIRKAPKIIYNE